MGGYFASGRPAHLLAYGIRFDFVIGPKEWANIWAVLPWLLPTKIALFFFFGLYQGMWRYTGVTDLFNILRARLAIWKFGERWGTGLVVVSEYRNVIYDPFALEVIA